MSIRIDSNEAAMQVLHRISSNLRELTYNYNGLPANGSFTGDMAFSDVLKEKLNPQPAEPSAWNDGFSPEKGVSYTASRVIDEQLHAMTKVKVAALKAEMTSDVRLQDFGGEAGTSTVRDVEVAKAMTEGVRDNMLSQAAQAMLSQANFNSSKVLSLLQ